MTARALFKGFACHLTVDGMIWIFFEGAFRIMCGILSSSMIPSLCDGFFISSSIRFWKGSCSFV